MFTGTIFQLRPVNLPQGQGHVNCNKNVDPIGSAVFTYFGHTQIFRQAKLKKTRLLERFAPIFYLNCEHYLFVYILKQKQ